MRLPWPRPLRCAPPPPSFGLGAVALCVGVCAVALVLSSAQPLLWLHMRRPRRRSCVFVVGGGGGGTTLFPLAALLPRGWAEALVPLWGQAALPRRRLSLDSGFWILVGPPEATAKPKGRRRQIAAPNRSQGGSLGPARVG